MSLLGFDRAIRNLDTYNKRFLKDAIKSAQKEFKSNFDNERDSESGTSWARVKRHVPPPILNVTGKLKGEAIKEGRVVYTLNRAILTIDPIDEKGKGYAQYHQDGIGRVTERAFVTQSENLTNEHISLLDRMFDDTFN